MHRESTPAPPSGLVEGVDPGVERVILRCLAKDPADRPTSALAVAAALPGGDPLAAALAAGETPAPEVVAEAGETGGLYPRIAWACLSGVVLGLLLIIRLSDKVTMLSRIPAEKPPDVLVDKAREVIRKLGAASPPADSAYGFGTHVSYLRYVAERDASPELWDRLGTGQPAAIFFWYRQSPHVLEPSDPQGLVGVENPPPLLSGMAMTYLDLQGHLWQFQSVPPQVDDSRGTWRTPDWSPLFAEAGLELSTFRPVEPNWNPPVYADSRAAWEGFYPGSREPPIRVEAAAYHGKPVYFQVLGPWSPPLRMTPLTEDQNKAGNYVTVVVMAILLIVGVVLARRNLLRGRGDRRGALRVAFYLFLVQSLGWALQAHHVPNPIREWWGVFLPALSEIFLLSGMAWLFYVALEPYIRRKKPETIIAWSRLLAGRLRDPLVGRDILVGVLFGVASSLVSHLRGFAPTWFGLPPPFPSIPEPATLLGLRGAFSQFFAIQLEAALSAMGLLFVLVLLRVLLRWQWMAYAVFCLLLVVFMWPKGEGGNAWFDLFVSGFNAAIVATVLIRFGPLGLASWSLVHQLLSQYPITSDLTAWYAGSCLLALLTIVALALYGLFISIERRPLFGKELLED